MRIPSETYRRTGGQWSTAVLIAAVCCGAACASSKQAEKAREEPSAPVPVAAANDPRAAEVEEARLSEEHWERVPVAAGNEPRPAVAAAEELRFGPGEAVLTPDARASLDRLASRLRAESAACQVDLRASSADSDPGLTRKRAAAVRQYLSRQGIPAGRISENAVAAGAGSAPGCVLVANLG